MMEKINALNMLFDNLKQNRKGLIRLWLILIAIHFISLLLGFAIFLIVFGVQIAVRRIVIYWTPARNWFAKTFYLTLPEYDISKVSPFYKLFVNIFHAGIALLFFAIGFYVIKLGVEILLREGFLGQNFIYLIFFQDK